MKAATRRKQKVKIGTVLDTKVLKMLKERAVREGKPINALIEEAILRYDQLDVMDHAVRLKALNSLLSARFEITNRDWRTVMGEDVFGNEP